MTDFSQQEISDAMHAIRNIYKIQSNKTTVVHLSHKFSPTSVSSSVTEAVFSILCLPGGDGFSDDNDDGDDEEYQLETPDPATDLMNRFVTQLPDSKRGRCAKCEREFSTLASARRHWVRAHESKGKRYKCPMCFKFYSNEVAVQEHLRVKHHVFRRDLKQQEDGASRARSSFMSVCRPT